MITVDRGIVKYDKRVLMYTEREYIKKADNLVCGDTPGSGESLITVLAVNYFKNIKLESKTCLLSIQLPIVENVCSVQ
jgi:hypothetical protein